MRTSKNVLFLIVAVLTTVAIVPMAQAGFIPEQAQDAVNAFNSLNNGQGYYYNVTSENGRWSISAMPGFEQANFDAYSHLVSGENYAKTFCVEPPIETGARHYGTLNYANGSTTTQSGDYLTVGAAYLYKAFASGILEGYDYENPKYTEGKDLASAIQFLMDLSFLESPWTNWDSNDFLAELLIANADKTYWEQVYDPGKYYDEIGDYSVFVMNNRDEHGMHTQDFLYLAAHDNNAVTTTPEPATLLLLGLAALAGIPAIRRRY